MSKMKVCEKKCEECLFSKNRIVSKERAQAIMRKIVRTDSHFMCHKGQGDVVCAGSVDFHQGQLYRIMGRLDGIELVDPESLKL